jgi:hypothetical protein
MAQAKNKRKRKHRGTPAGTVERAGRTGRPATKQDAKTIARERRAERLDRPPTWRGAVNRAAVAAVVLAALAVLILGYELSRVALLALFMFLLYIPLGYATDSADRKSTRLNSSHNR